MLHSGSVQPPPPLALQHLVLGVVARGAGYPGKKIYIKSHMGCLLSMLQLYQSISAARRVGSGHARHERNVKKRHCRGDCRYQSSIKVASTDTFNYPGMERWKVRVAIATGASAGIGYELSKRLVQLGVVC